MKHTVVSRVQLALVVAAVGGAIGVAAAGPAGAATVGLLKASQLPSGYKALGHPITISGSEILKATASLGSGLGSATSTCKGAPSPASLRDFSAHVVAFGKPGKAGSASILGEVVLQAPSATDAEAYFAAEKSSSASCSGTKKLSMDGVSLSVKFAEHDVSIAKVGADEAVGTVARVAAKTTTHGVTATLSGALSVQTYRSGANIVEVLVDNFGTKVDMATKSVAIAFSPGSPAVATSVGKAAIEDL